MVDPLNPGSLNSRSDSKQKILVLELFPIVSTPIPQFPSGSYFGRRYLGTRLYMTDCILWSLIFLNIFLTSIFSAMHQIVSMAGDQSKPEEPAKPDEAPKPAPTEETKEEPKPE